MPKPGSKHSGDYVCYLRVSTQRQGKSGLGLSAQKTLIDKHLNGGNWKLIGEFVEVETGRRTDRHRKELKKALDLCKTTKATLVVAKLDRLTRNVSFLSKLLDSRVPFIACDIPEMHNPATTKFMLQLMANVAEYEAKLISDRTKASLAEKKKQGVKLGTPNPQAGSALGIKQAQEIANETAYEICEVVSEIMQTGVYTLSGIKQCLEARGVKTPMGRKVWSLSSVRNTMIRGGIYDNRSKGGN